jgi:hypothetical protein
MDQPRKVVELDRLNLNPLMMLMRKTFKEEDYYRVQQNSKRVCDQKSDRGCVEGGWLLRQYR